MFRRDNAGLPRDAEKLRVVEFLALVRNVDVAVRREGRLAVNEGREIARRIERCAVRLPDNAGRQFLLVAGLRDVHDERALGAPRNAALLEVFEECRDKRLRIGLTLPELERDRKRIVVLL